MCILFLTAYLNNSCYILQDINTRLKNIINGAPCVLFMKGSPQEPRCGKQFVFKNNLFLSNFWITWTLCFVIKMKIFDFILSFKVTLLKQQLRVYMA